MVTSVSPPQCCVRSVTYAMACCARSGEAVVTCGDCCSTYRVVRKDGKVWWTRLEPR